MEKNKIILLREEILNKVNKGIADDEVVLTHARVWSWIFEWNIDIDKVSYVPANEKFLLNLLYELNIGLRPKIVCLESIDLFNAEVLFEFFNVITLKFNIDVDICSESDYEKQYFFRKKKEAINALEGVFI